VVWVQIKAVALIGQPQGTPTVPRFAANLSLLYNEHAFLDRFAAAAKDGFRAVEYLFPYEYQAVDLAQRLRDNGLKQVLFNAPPGDWADGDRGTAAVPGREAEFRVGFERALDYAQALDCPRIHAMAGLVTAQDAASVRGTYLANLAWAAQAAALVGCEVLIEPINTRDMPGYYLNRQDVAHAIVEEVDEPNLKVQFDLYHCQIMEGDVATKLRRYVPSGRVGHIQVAGVPERHEPDLGELNYAYLFELIDALSLTCGWQGYVGCEYRPRLGTAPGATAAGLGWLRQWL
jgi:hydroxypyruvate isomerase